MRKPNTVTTARQSWEDSVLKKALARSAERKERFETTSGIEIKRVYTSEDTQDDDYQEKLDFPGQYPFTRGVQPTMYRGRFWTMRQYAGFGTAEESNQRYRYLLEQGQTGLSVAFDLPTQMGPGFRPCHGRWRSRPGGRGHRLAGGHGNPAGRHSAGQSQHLHDH